jgi:hypothetical protein
MAAKSGKTAKKNQGAVQGMDLMLDEKLLELYKAYEPLLGENLWPWESQRWTELVFCILNASTRPEVAPESIREVARVLEKSHLIDIAVLGSLDPYKEKKDSSHPHVVAMEAILKNYGFAEDEIQTAVTIMCQMAAGFKNKFGGKVQKCLRQYGMNLLKEMERDFPVQASNAKTARTAFTQWFQNVLNLPLPAPDEISDKACKMLRTDYVALIQAADDIDVNVALLDNILRAYWQREIEIGEE